uniref:RPM1-interacting protein 4 isoform X2 n=1 Tax=Rhizophora mucronata TaxID=61149 RepID=A0A2P2Q4D8_RHIMU
MSFMFPSCQHTLSVWVVVAVPSASACPKTKRRAPSLTNKPGLNSCGAHFFSRYTHGQLLFFLAPLPPLIAPLSSTGPPPLSTEAKELATTTPPFHSFPQNISPSNHGGEGSAIAKVW